MVKSTTGHSSCHSASRGATGNDQDCQKSRAHRPAGPCEAALRGEAAVPGADGGPDDVPDLSPNLPPPSRRAARPCEAAWRGEAAAPTADRARLLTVGSQQTERQHRRRTIPDDVPEPRGPICGPRVARWPLSPEPGRPPASEIVHTAHEGRAGCTLFPGPAARRRPALGGLVSDLCRVQRHRLGETWIPGLPDCARIRRRRAIWRGRLGFRWRCAVRRLRLVRFRSCAA